MFLTSPFIDQAFALKTRSMSVMAIYVRRVKPA